MDLQGFWRFILRGPKKATRSKSLSVNQTIAISMLFLASSRCATIFSFMRSVSNMGPLFLLFLLNFFDILIGITIFPITNIQNNLIQNSRFCKKKGPLSIFVITALRIHLFPFRTASLSATAPMVLHPWVWESRSSPT